MILARVFHESTTRLPNDLDRSTDGLGLLTASLPVIIALREIPRHHLLRSLILSRLSPLPVSPSSSDLLLCRKSKGSIEKILRHPHSNAGLIRRHYRRPYIHALHGVIQHPAEAGEFHVHRAES